MLSHIMLSDRPQSSQKNLFYYHYPQLRDKLQRENYWTQMIGALPPLQPSVFLDNYQSVLMNTRIDHCLVS